MIINISIFKIRKETDKKVKAEKKRKLSKLGRKKIKVN
jgi:hypothetical protein